MIDVLWLITRLIPGGTRNIFLWSLELLQEQIISGSAPRFRFSVASGPEGIDKELQQALSKSGVMLYTIPHLYRSVNIINDLLALNEIEKLLHAHNFQLVHTHTSKAGYLGRLAAKRTNIPAIVHTPHGHLFNIFFSGTFRKLKTKLAIALEKQGAKWCDIIVALSQKEATDYLELKIKPKKEITIIPNGIPSHLIPTIISSKQQPGTVIGFLGRLVPEKGVIDLLEAFSVVRKNIPAAKLIIAGDGPLRDDLILEAHKKNIAKDVVFLGYNDNLTSFWEQIDLFVLPSHSEGFGLVLLEAMAHNKGIVATKVGGIPEIIDYNVTGELVPPQHPAALANAIIQQLNNPEKTLLMGIAARKKLLTCFSLEKQVHSLINMYHTLLPLNP